MERESDLQLPINSSTLTSAQEKIALEKETNQKEMEVVSEIKSSLNPDAPIFIPEHFHEVEDFSPEWWDLVKTSTWFRDFWLNKNKEEEDYFFDDNDKNELAALLPDSFNIIMSEEEEEFHKLEGELDDMVRSSEAEEHKNESSSSESKKPSQLEINETQAP